MVSVTQVLQVLNRFDFVPREVLATAAEHGIEVHKVALAYAKGFYIPATSDIAPYADSFRTWFDETIVEVLAIELALEDQALELKGHVDLIARIKGERKFSVMDLKRTAAIHWSVGLQLGAYEYLAEKKFSGHEFGIKRAIHIGPDARIRAVPFPDPSDRVEFFHCLSLYRHAAKMQRILP